jgi:hypothetical protein
MDGANVNTVKKVSRFSRPWPEIIKLFQPRDSLVSDIQTGGGNIDNLFYSVADRFLNMIYKKCYRIT